MNTILKAGIVLGVLVEIWTYLMGFTGWYKDPALMNLFFVVIAIQIAVLMWALKRTAAEGRGFGGQVGAGTLISLIGGVFVIVGSLIFTIVVFPNYFTDLAVIHQRRVRNPHPKQPSVFFLRQSFQGFGTEVRRQNYLHEG